MGSVVFLTKLYEVLRSQQNVVLSLEGCATGMSSEYLEAAPNNQGTMPTGQTSCKRGGVESTLVRLSSSCRETNFNIIN